MSGMKTTADKKMAIGAIHRQHLTGIEFNLWYLAVFVTSQMTALTRLTRSLRSASGTSDKVCGFTTSKSVVDGRASNTTTDSAL